MSALKFGNKSELKVKIAKLTPPRSKNWNWSKENKGGYAKQFSVNFIEHIFPYLLKNMRELYIPMDNLKILDIGCGWAPLAIPFLIFKSKAGSEATGGAISYLGIDIREDAIEWLSNAYASYPDFKFQWHRAITEADYIGAQHSKSKTLYESDGRETNFEIQKDFP